MKNLMAQLKSIMALVLVLASTSYAVADTQTLTILGANGTQGDIDPYTEASRDGGLTWQPAYLTGWHPWNFIAGTNSWVNFDPSPFVGLNSSTLYRIRFNAPADWTNPQMEVLLKADNQGIVSFNGEFVGDITGTATIDADLVFADNLRPGMNEIQIELIDWGGWVGLNYRIDLSVEADEGFEPLPSEFGPLGGDDDDDGFSNAEEIALGTDPQTANCSNPRNHGQYVSCVAHLLNQLVELGMITDEEKDARQSVAAESDVAKPAKGKGNK